MNESHINEEWEKEFDNRFWLHRIPRNTKQMLDIKDFIRTLRSQALEEGREEALEEAYILVKARWKFDNNQQYRHSWHDMVSTLEALSNLRKV